MSSGEGRGEIRREEAEALARQVIELFSLFTSLLKPGEDPLKTLEFLRQVIEHPDVAKQRLVEEIMSSSSPEQLAVDCEHVGAFLDAPRRLVDEIRRELPQGQPGRPAVGASDEQLIATANRFLPVCRALVQLRAHPTKQPVESSVQYLATDFPDLAAELLPRIESVERVLSAPKLSKRARTAEGKARVLAYVLAGETYGYSGTYALRQVRTAFHRQRRQKT